MVSRVLECFLRSPLAGASLDSNGRSDTLSRLCLDKDFGEVVTNTGDALLPSDYIDVSNRVLRTLSFQLTDASGNILSLHGIDFSFELAIQFGPIE